MLKAENQSIPPTPTPTALAMTTSTTMMMMMFILILILILERVFCQTAQNGSTNGPQEPMIGLLAQEMPRHPATDTAQQPSFSLRHGRRVGIVIRRVRVGRLGTELVLLDCLIELLLVVAGATLAHLSLVCLVLGIGVVSV